MLDLIVKIEMNFTARSSSYKMYHKYNNFTELHIVLDARKSRDFTIQGSLNPVTDFTIDNTLCIFNVFFDLV